MNVLDWVQFRGLTGQSFDFKTRQQHKETSIQFNSFLCSSYFSCTIMEARGGSIGQHLVSREAETALKIDDAFYPGHRAIFSDRTSSQGIKLQLQCFAGQPVYKSGQSR